MSGWLVTVVDAKLVWYSLYLMGLVQTFSVLRRECSEEMGSVYGWSTNISSGWGGKGVGGGESIGEEKACGLCVVMEGWARVVGSTMLRVEKGKQFS